MLRWLSTVLLDVIRWGWHCVEGVVGLEPNLRKGFLEDADVEFWINSWEFDKNGSHLCQWQNNLPHGTPLLHGRLQCGYSWGWSSVGRHRRGRVCRGWMSSGMVENEARRTRAIMATRMNMTISNLAWADVTDKSNCSWQSQGIGEDGEEGEGGIVFALREHSHEWPITNNSSSWLIIF